MQRCACVGMHMRNTYYFVFIYKDRVCTVYVCIFKNEYIYIYVYIKVLVQGEHSVSEGAPRPCNLSGWIPAGISQSCPGGGAAAA